MSKPAVVVVALISALAGYGVSQWMQPPRDNAPTLPPSRSKTTVAEDFAPPGLTGEVREVLLIPDLLERTKQLSALLLSLGPESVEPVRNAYDGVVLDLGDTELVLFGEWWARFDPPAAMAWTQQTWSARQSIPVLRAVMRAWGREDPLAAIASASSAPNDRLRLRWTESALRGWDESVQDGVLEYAESLGQGPDRQWALYVVTRRKVLRDGPEAAIAWAEDLPDDDALFKLNAYRRVAGAAASVDPSVATAFVERQLGGPYEAGLPQRVGMSWVKHDPEAAFGWLATLPAGQYRDEAVRESYFNWELTEPARARAWIAAADPEPWLDPALSVYVKGIVRRDVERALAVALGIHDAEIRKPTVGTVARHWLVQDEAAANAWLEQSDLPAKYIEKIRVVPNSVREMYADD